MRCHGTARPPNASPTTRSTLSSGTRFDRPPRVADTGPGCVSLGSNPSCSRATASTLGSSSSTVCADARPGRLEISREREPAAADVEDVDRPAEPVEVRPDRVGEPPDVGELEVGRIGQVDVRVGQAIEDEDPAVRRRSGRPRPRCSSRRSRCRTGTARRAPTRPTRRRRVPAPRSVARRRPASATVSTSPITTSRPPTATISTRVGTSPSRTNPVRNVPVIAPTVPIAESRPTIEPLVARSVRVARTSIGPTADRIAAGATKPTVARVTIARKPVAEPGGAEGPDDRHRRDGRHAAEHEGRPEQRHGPERVGRAPAEPRADRDACQDRADDPGVRRERHPDVRCQQASRGDLEHEHRARGDEGQGRRNGPGEAADAVRARLRQAARRPGRIARRARSPRSDRSHRTRPRGG